MAQIIFSIRIFVATIGLIAIFSTPYVVMHSASAQSDIGYGTNHNYGNNSTASAMTTIARDTAATRSL